MGYRPGAMTGRSYATCVAVALSVVSAPAAAQTSTPDQPVSADAPASPGAAGASAPRAQPAVLQPAQPPGPAQPGPPLLREPLPSTREFADAPRPAPGAQRGVVAGMAEPSAWWWLPRGVLLVPRYALEIVFAPLRGLAYAYDRYNLAERFRLVFFNDAQTFGVYPVALFETGFGLNAGARLIHKDLFGHGERLRLRAGAGGRFQQLYRLELESGRALGEARLLHAAAEYEVRPRDRFFGIGNAEERTLEDLGIGEPAPDADPQLPLPGLGDGIDPLVDDTAIETRFRQSNLRLELGYEQALREHLSLRSTAVYRRREFGPPDADGDASWAAIGQVYRTDRLVGFGQGSSLSNVYAELELTLDTRRSTRREVWQPGAGYRLELFVGYTHGVGDDPSDYLRYGADASYLVPIYRGDRTLVVRAFFEAVSAERDEIPFTDLPRLGGPILLRGFDRDRFRDTLAAMVSAEYQYPVARNVLAFAFTDIGRVYQGWSDVALDELRYTYGFGLQSHSQTSPQLRIHVAASTDGDVVFALSFDPAHETPLRSERK
jgi:hypothetical protein